MARSNFYSKAVVWVKITLPLVGIALLSSIFLLASTPDPDDALPYAEVDVDQIQREQSITQPRYAGVLSERQEIVFTADAASTLDGQTDRIITQNLDGRVDLSDTRYLTLESLMGDIDMAAQIATLTDDVMVQTSSGYTATSDQMFVALNVFNIISPSQIHIFGNGVDLVADTMDLTQQDGQTIAHFNGSVRVIYQPTN